MLINWTMPGLRGKEKKTLSVPQSEKNGKDQRIAGWVLSCKKKRRAGGSALATNGAAGCEKGQRGPGSESQTQPCQMARHDLGKLGGRMGREAGNDRNLNKPYCRSELKEIHMWADNGGCRETSS